MKIRFLSPSLVAGAVSLFSATFVSAQKPQERCLQIEQELTQLRQQVADLEARHARELAELRALLGKEAAPAAPAAVGAPAPSAPVSLFDLAKQGAVAPPTAAPAGPTFFEQIREGASPRLSVGGPGVELDLSVVLDMYYYRDNADGGMNNLRENIRGFSHERCVERGFNLRYVELMLSAAVDPYFRAWAMVAMAEEGAEVEEAVIQTTGLPYGLTLSGGKIRSGIGRLNRQHAHAWEFVDQPLVYDSLFGDHGLMEKGLQLTWLAPAPFYLLFGAELFNGDNDQSFATAEGEGLRSRDAPRLATVFVKAGPDLGPHHAMQIGLSGLAGRHQQANGQDQTAEGETWIVGSDFVYKHDARRPHGHGDFVFQAEYFYRDMDLSGRGGWAGASWQAKQDGYYAQALYGFLPRWRCGLRWDHIGLVNNLRSPEAGSVSYRDSKRLTGMLDLRLTEFSLLRAQVGQGWHDMADGRESAWEFALQWQVNFGKHPAHDF